MIIKLLEFTVGCRIGPKTREGHTVTTSSPLLFCKIQCLTFCFYFRKLIPALENVRHQITIRGSKAGMDLFDIILTKVHLSLI